MALIVLSFFFFFKFSFTQLNAVSEVEGFLWTTCMKTDTIDGHPLTFGKQSQEPPPKTTEDRAWKKANETQKRPVRT